MNDEQIKTILAKLNKEEQQQITVLVNLNNAVVDFIHKDKTEWFKEKESGYKDMIKLYSLKLAETGDTVMLDHINYANNKLSGMNGYSKCLSDLSSMLFYVYANYKKYGDD